MFFWGVGLLETCSNHILFVKFALQRRMCQKLENPSESICLFLRYSFVDGLTRRPRQGFSFASGLGRAGCALQTDVPWPFWGVWRSSGRSVFFFSVWSDGCLGGMCCGCCCFRFFFGGMFFWLVFNSVDFKAFI